LIKYRFLFVIAIFFILLIFNFFDWFNIKFIPSVILLIILFLLNNFYSNLVKHKKFNDKIEFYSLIIDIIFLSIFTYITGDVFSPFYFLFYFIIFIISYKYNKIGALLLLILIILFYYAVILLSEASINNYIRKIEFLKILSFIFLYYLFEVIKKFKDKTQQLNIIIAQKNNELLIIKRDLEIANKELEYKNTQYLDMIGFISHELKNPLVSIMSLSELFKNNEEKNLTEEQVQALNVIHRNAVNMKNMIDDYLNLAKLDQGEIEPKIQEIDLLNDVIYPTIEDQQKLLSEKKLTIQNETSNGFTKVHSDLQLLKIIYQNLINNAIKYSYPNSVIYYGVLQKDDQQIYYVRNKSKPIPPDKIDKIFNKFERLERDAHIKGSGLGLFNCKKIIETLKGKIWCESSYETETVTFYFTLGKM